MKRHPRLAETLLRRVIPVEYSEELIGDLTEEFFCFVYPERGPWRAGLWFWRQSLAAAAHHLLERSLLKVEPRIPRNKGEEGNMENLWKDIRYAVRSLRKSPTFSLVVILTLALGIGANTLIYSVVDNLILNPFPFPEPETLIGIGPVFPKLNQPLGFFEVISPPEFEDIKGQSQTLEKVVAWDMGNRQISGKESTENVFSSFWWGNAFETLGVKPHLGRGFSYEETVGEEPLAIVSHRYWVNRFGADPSMIGDKILVNGNPFTLIGIMPPGTLIYGTDLWIPMSVAPARFPRNRRQWQVLGRIKDGYSQEQVRAEVSGISNRIEAEYGQEFEEYAGWSLVSQTWDEINTSRLQSAAVILMGAVGFVLLIVCANLASLLLARALGRQQELAVRIALGATKRRLINQLMTDSVLLGLVGGAAGLLVCAIGVLGVRSMLETLARPIAGEVALNGRVLAFNAIISIGAGLIFGLLPAIQATGMRIGQTLQQEGSRATLTAGKRRLQTALVTLEVAIAVVLLMGCGLLVHSFMRLQQVDPGFNPDNVLTMRLTLPWEKYPNGGIAAFFETLVQQVESIPGVASASATSQFPPNAFGRGRFWVEGSELRNEGQLPVAFLTQASDRYFETMGIDLLKGRSFESSDRAGTPFVAVINEKAADMYFSGEDPIGRRFKLGGPDSEQPTFAVIGVVRSTNNRGLDVAPQPELFALVRQGDGWNNQLFLTIKTTVPPRNVLSAVRAEVENIDPEQPVYAIQTVEEAFARSVAQRRIAVTALSVFAIFALLLAAVGIFAVVSHGVARRTQEIGVRLALGASHYQVRGLVTRQTLTPVVIGTLLGLGISFGLSSFMTDLLFEVSGTDPWTIFGVTGTLLGAALMASYLPARRASHLDPVLALRYE